MKKVILILALLAVFVAPGFGEDCCKGGIISVELKQSHFSLDVWKHVKDSMNAVKFHIEVSCALYDKLNVGDDLLKMSGADTFRGGSFWIDGSIGDWSMKVISKEGKK